MMNLFNQAIADANSFMQKDFGVSMDFVAPTSETATIMGWTSKHHVAFDTEGNQVNSKTANITLSEQDLTNAGYPVRNNQGEVSMRNHLVYVKDSTQTISKYKVMQYYQDERLGLITLILSDFV